MKRIISIVFGNLLITGAYAFITVPNKIVNGGVTSFSMVLGQLFSINLSIFVNMFIILLLFLCLIFLGKEFFMGSVFSCVCYLLLFTFFHNLKISFSMSPVLCIIIAGLSVGAGYYLCIHAKSTAVSFDVVALILNKKNPKVNVAFTIGIINSLILLMGFVVYGILSVVYGIMFTVVQSWTLNILQKYEQ